MIVEFLRSIAKSIRNMMHFNEEKIAAAQIAQLFGSELLKVQQSVNDSTSMPDIVKLNPKSFLFGDDHMKSQQSLRDRQVAEALQRQAESMHPLPQNSSPPPQSLPQPIALLPAVPNSVDSFSTPNQTSVSLDVHYLERIASSLERIANKIDAVDIKPKRKTIKRKLKSKKPILLNENHV